MDISKLAKKPKLVELVISDEDIVEKYGEPISFWMMDEVDITTYFEFYKLQQSQETGKLYELMRTLLKKSDGTACLADDEILPVNLMLAVLVRINDFLGKSEPNVAETETGSLQN